MPKSSEPPEISAEPALQDLPLVSICIPTYNRAGMVGKAIGSALDQTYPNIEVIVVDNASTDSTAEVVGGFKDARLRFVRNERNLGLFGNFNRCIELASGEYVHILHSDDSIESGFTRRCMEFFHAHPDVVLTSTGARIFGEGFEKDIGCSDTDTVFKAPDGYKRLLSTRSFIVCPSVMVRKAVFQEVGPFSLEFPYSADYYQWLKIARLHDIGYVSGTRVNYCQGNHSETYRFLFASPVGYLDMVRIFIRLRLDSGKDLDAFSSEFIDAQRRYIHDCIFAGFTRGDAMDGFSPLSFAGIALCCWTLERPVSAVQWLRKIFDLLVLVPASLLIGWSVTRKIVRSLFFSGKKCY